MKHAGGLPPPAGGGRTVRSRPRKEFEPRGAARVPRIVPVGGRALLVLHGLARTRIRLARPVLAAAARSAHAPAVLHDDRRGLGAERERGAELALDSHLGALTRRASALRDHLDLAGA